MKDQLSKNNPQSKSSRNAHLSGGIKAHGSWRMIAGIATVLGLIYTTLASHDMARQATLLLAAPSIFAILYVDLPATERSRIGEWLVDRSLTLTAVIMTCLLVASLFLWAIVSFWWQPAYEAQVTAVVVNEQSVYVTVSHPGGLLADGHPVAVQLDITNRTDVTRTVGVTTVLPVESHLQFATLPTLPALPVPPHSQLTKTIALANSNPLANFKVTEQLTTIVSHSGTVDETETSLAVEGWWGLRLRSLVNSTVDKASPLIILIAFLAPALAQITQLYVQERKLRQQEEKKQFLIRSQEEHRQVVSQLVKKLRNGMAVGDWSRAGKIFNQLIAIEWDGAEQNDQEIAKKLLLLAKLECPAEEITSIVQECAIWQNESVGAFLNAWEKAKQQEDDQTQKQFAALKKARHLLPLEGIRTELANRLANLEMAIVAQEKDNFEFQPIRDWPRPPQHPVKFPVEFVPFVGGIPGQRDPFAYEKAEYDLYHLFNFRESLANAFWGGHPLFKELFSVDRVTLVFGASGNGCTTLAYALHYYASQREVFALHLPGCPKPDEIRAAFANHMLDFILTYPVSLRQLTFAQRQLLAYLLVSAQSATSLCARIEAKQATIYSAFSTTPENERDDAGIRLQLLANDIRVANASPSVDDIAWAGNIAVMVQALGFARLLLVLDASGSNDYANWLQESVWTQLLPWQRQGLLTILFLPDDDEAKEIAAKLNYANRWQLTWNRNQIEFMLTWRYKSFAGPRQALQQHFEEDVFDYLLSKCLLVGSNVYDLKAFIENWHHLTARVPPDELITQAHVDQYAQAGMTKESGSRDYQVKAAEANMRPVSTQPASTPGLTDDILHRILVNYFDLEELHTLCFYMGENYEDVSGTETVSGFAREMVGYFRRRGKLAELTLKIKEERPQLPF